MTYSIHYLAGVGAKRLGLSAAEVEVPTSDDGYGEFLNGYYHEFSDPTPDEIIDDAIGEAIMAIEKIEELMECLKELKEQNQ